MTDQTQTSHPATIAPAWDVTATVTVTGAFAARYAHSGLSTALATIADEIDVSDIAVEAHRRDPATAGTYGETLAREIADELDRRAGQPIGWTVLLDHWTDQVPPTLFRATLDTRDWAQAEADRLNADPDPGESYRPVAVYAAEQAADGLDDQDKPVTRGQLHTETYNGAYRYWIDTPGGWWLVEGPLLRPPRWQSGPRDGADLTPLGCWVEIPAEPAPATSEEQASA